MENILIEDVYEIDGKIYTEEQLKKLRTRLFRHLINSIKAGLWKAENYRPILQKESKAVKVR